MERWQKTIGLTALSALVATGLAACSSDSKSDSSKFTLRVAMASPGDELIKVWEDIGKQYEDQNPGVKVEFNFQDDDTYQTVGLPSLLKGKNAPDLYFEWAGQRVANHVADGSAADITSLVQSTGLNDMFDTGSWNGSVIDGKTYMIPTNGDQSNVIWYNKQLFTEAGITAPPATWEEFIADAQKLKDKGITPIVAGNKDLWVAGNWIGHLISRVVGEQAYSDALQLKTPFNSPDFVTAYGYVKELWDKGYVNDSINALADNEADESFFNGQGAMHPIGSWLVSMQLEEAPDMQLDYFNLPAMPGGKGDQGSVLGVITGMVVNAKSSHQEAAVNFMKLYSSVDNSKKLSAAGIVPIAKGGIDESSTPALSISLDKMMKETATLVAPPDTGYSIEVANALNTATSQVIGGAKSPEDALKQLDDTVAPLKK